MTTRSAEEMRRFDKDRIRQKIEIPFSLSLPYFILAIFLTFAGLFLLLNIGMGFFVETFPTRKFLCFTTVRREFMSFDGVDKIRWLYYIPLKALFPKITYIFSLMGIGVAMLLIRYLALDSYVKKTLARQAASS